MEAFNMKYVYPAIFTPLEDEGGYDVYIPDLCKMHIRRI